MSLVQEDARELEKLAREDIRVALKMLNAATIPAERRLKSGVQSRIGALYGAMQTMVDRRAPRITVTEVKEPWQMTAARRRLMAMAERSSIST